MSASEANDVTTKDFDLIADIVQSARVAVLTTASPEGDLHARPLAMQVEEFTGDIEFLVQDNTEKVRDVQENPRVNVAIEAKGSYLSIAGTARVARDPARIDALWSPFAEAWFPEGRDDPTITVLTVSADSAEYWAQTDGKVASLFKGVKAMLRHEQPDIGENRTVEF